ncbi:glycosyltransferase family 2 protein [Chitinophaga deserti]|uniref:glycosyltransferase family 2 protein n=1 Tax=Chitinophaga deserti TaxID=2164099 RepID=UPI0018E515BF|nr:glycosyltransferase family 2 protein [Chitinophaga deserti]
MQLSIVIPCLNEARTLRTCIRKAKAFLAASGIRGEIIISDNGSSDGSLNIAAEEGVRLLHAPEKGYGMALMHGMNLAEGSFIVMGDADDSYDFLDLQPFVEAHERGGDLVIGNRFLGGIEKDAMPFLHRYLGNPVLTGIGRLFFKAGIGDFHCGLRGISKSAYEALDLKMPGMEFASEMIVKASLKGLKIVEVPTRLYPDAPGRKPHLNTWRDGWRHLRFLLLFCPRWLFFYPGLLLAAAGVLVALLLTVRDLAFPGFMLGVHTQFYTLILAGIGLQMCFFSLLGRYLGELRGIFRVHGRHQRLIRYIRSASGFWSGMVLFAGGLLLGAQALQFWAERHYGSLDPSVTFKTILPSGFLLLFGFQLMVACMFLNLCQLFMNIRQEGASQ